MTQILALLLSLAPEPPTREAAEAAFERGEFEHAADAYDALYASTGDPGHLYAGAQARRRAEQWGEAADRYDRFVLHAEPLLAGFEGSQRAQLEQMIVNAREQAAACRERAGTDEPAVEPPPVAPPRVTVEVPPPSAATEPPSDHAPARAWSRDPAAITLVSVGGALVVGGAAIFIAAAGLDRTAESAADDHDDFLARLDRAALLQKIAPVPLAIGAALVIGGAIRFAVVRKRSRARPVAGGVAIHF